MGRGPSPGRTGAFGELELLELGLGEHAFVFCHREMGFCGQRVGSLSGPIAHLRGVCVNSCSLGLHPNPTFYWLRGFAQSHCLSWSQSFGV